MSEPIPVSVLTGFLGSGKTTLLNRLVRAPGLKDTAVIVNEFGEVGLDHLLVAEGDETVVLLDSGCICCTIANTLTETLADLSFRRARGDVPAFKRVIVETTGLADPAAGMYGWTQHNFVEKLLLVVPLLSTLGLLGVWLALFQRLRCRRQDALQSPIPLCQDPGTFISRTARGICTGAILQLNISRA